MLLTSWAATGSVTAEYTTGTSLVAATTACADGVAMATMASGRSPTNLRAICAAVPLLPCALWYCHFRFLPDSKPACLRASCTPSRTASSAGCSTMAVTATDFCCAYTGAAIAIASAMAPTVRKCFFPISILSSLNPWFLFITTTAPAASRRSVSRKAV
ncbi:hypothetical protein D3C73_947630 [compost metagenome]